MTGGPPGDELSGERLLADYRGGLLRLTDLRVVYRGRGRSRRLRASLSLEAVTAAGIARRGGNPALFGLPLGILLLAFIMALTIEKPEPLVPGFLAAMASLPFVLFMGRTVIQIAAGGYLLQVPVSRGHDEQAHRFLSQLDMVRFYAEDERTRGAGTASPSTQPYGTASAVGRTTSGG